MEFEVTSEMNAIDFGATGVSEILQNVRMILATSRFSCPLDRSFAWDPTILDAPINLAKAKLTTAIIDAIRQYEPRAQVLGVSFRGDGMNGQLVSVVRVVIADAQV